MPKPKKGTRYGGSPQHHNMIMANLATELFRHGRIRTTKAKAKTVQPVAERMITFAKKGDLHARRRVLTVIRDKDVVHKLFTDIGPAAVERNGGYTRVVKLGPRKGDGAEMAMIELVDAIEGEGGENVLAQAPRRRWSLRRRLGTISQSAREREEALQAAEDRGEFLDDVELEEVDTSKEAAEEEAVAAGRITERALAREEEAARAEDETEVRPEDVEARLAEDEDESEEPESDDDSTSEDDSTSDEEE